MDVGEKMNTKGEKRRIDLDILKVIGLLCIIFAHANPPDILFRIRNFDVVLMILISAYLGLILCFFFYFI